MKLPLFNLVCGAAVLVAAPAAAFSIFDWLPGQERRGAELPRPETVVIAVRDLDYRQPGEFLAAGRPVPAPAEKAVLDRPLEIMAYQVSFEEYGRCVAAAACMAADVPADTGPQLPVTGVNYMDAVAYAAWYSRATGETWRLPTAAEWALAAGERFVGDTFIAADDASNPAVAWIRRYREEADRKRQADPVIKPAGFYGPNSNGVFDVAGNVWEWTSTCYFRATLTPDRAGVESVVENCGVHVMEGRHRAYMSNFIRDGKSGGCAVGTPPDNLGFRLVREQPPLLSLAGVRHGIWPSRN